MLEMLDRVGGGSGEKPTHGKESHLSRVVGDCRNNSKRGGCGGEEVGVALRK